MLFGLVLINIKVIVKNKLVLVKLLILIVWKLVVLVVIDWN